MDDHIIGVLELSSVCEAPTFQATVSLSSIHTSLDTIHAYLMMLLAFKRGVLLVGQGRGQNYECSLGYKIMIIF